MPELNKYTFDVKLFATFTVKAVTQQEGENKLRGALDCADANFGMLDGELLLAEASYDGEFDVAFINDEEPDA